MDEATNQMTARFAEAREQWKDVMHVFQPPFNWRTTIDEDDDSLTL